MLTQIQISVLFLFSYFLSISALDGLLSGAYNEHFMKFSNSNPLDNLTNQDSDIINVDVSTNQSELSSHVDNVSENGSVVNCYPDRQKSVCMKTKLSPATETHPQNNHAFNTGEEPLIISTCCYAGARPKVPLHTYSSSQTVTDENGVVGVAISSNVVNGSMLYSCKDTCVKSVSSQTDSSSKSQTSEVDHEQKTNSAIVGDYFFTNGGFNHKDVADDTKSLSAGDSVHSKPVQSFVDRFVRQDQADDIPRWADPACQGIKYADDDEQNHREVVFEGNIVFDSSQTLTPTSENQKRLYLAPSSEPDTKSADGFEPMKVADIKCVQRKMSSDLRTERKRSGEGSCNIGYSRDLKDPLDEESCIEDTTVFINKQNSSLLSEFERLDITQTSSLPNSPLHRLHMPNSPTKKLREEVLNGKCRHHSPLFKRKSKYSCSMDTAEDDNIVSIEDIKLPSNYKNLECFQKAQLKQKVVKTSCNCHCFFRNDSFV